MTTKEIIKLVAKTRTKRYTKTKILELTDRLSFFDAIDYLLWVNKLLKIEISL